MFLKHFLREERIMQVVGATAFTSCVFSYTIGVMAVNRHAKYFFKRGPDYKYVRPNEAMKYRFHELLKSVGFTEWNTEFFHVFVSRTEEIKRIGSTKTRNGVWIGYPEYFQCVKDEDIINTGIYSGVDWSSEDGKRLLDSLKLSEAAQNFILAKEIVMTDFYYEYIKCLMPSTLLMTYYAVGTQLHTWLKLLHKPIINSIIVHSITGIFFIFLYLFVKDAVYFKYDTAAHNKIYKLGEYYIQGAIEYYTKVLEKRKALRNLLESEKKWYNEQGDEAGLWIIFFAKGLATSFQLQLAKETLEKHYETKELMTPPKPRENVFPIY